MRTLAELLEMAKKGDKKRVVVADATEHDVFAAVEDARKQGLIYGILVGDSQKISDTAKSLGANIDDYEIIEEKNSKKTAAVAVEMLKDNKADVLMKGLVSTSDFMRAILNKEKGLLNHSAKKLISHIAVFEVPRYHKLLLITDAAINITPTLNEKVQILLNAVEVAHSLGIETPKVACVGAVEKVNPGKMPATEHAAILAMMNQRGQIRGCIVDGPFGFDNAINKKAAETKKIIGDVAGDADIILCPEIETANVLYKCLQYFANASCSAVVAGTPIPIVLTSRSDPHDTKLASLVLGVLMAQNK
ncbi:bifunctional enoyl-CoA hydratase/phosphate acetyltransferase [bacterium]|nr:bifunctional enoyl-CoA hydratase/phosphate acetyltransferase [bacterium]